MMENTKKFGLVYKLTIDTIDKQQLIISSFLENKRTKEKKILNEAPTVEISINKQTEKGGNEAKITIYNLNYETRKKLYKPKVSLKSYRNIEIEVGYLDYTSKIYKGNITYCVSYKEQDNIITEIFCNNSLIVNNSNIAMTIRDEADILGILVDNLPGLTVGEIDDLNNLFTQSKRGRSFYGNIWQIINNNNNKNLDIYIDDQQIYIKLKNGFLKNNIIVIDNETGLLDSPVENDGLLDIKTLFEPLAKLNNRVKLETTETPNYNGTYKVISFTHNITISTIGGESQGITTWRLLMNSKGKL